MLADGDLAQVRGGVALDLVSLRSATLPPELPGVVRHERHDGRHELHTADADALVRALVRSGVPFRDLRVAQASLEEAFLSLTAPRPEAARP